MCVYCVVTLSVYSQSSASNSTQRVIPVSHLCCSTAFGYKVMGFNVRLESKKYSRNALLFNIGFVLPADISATHFGPVLRKLTTVIETLEARVLFHGLLGQIYVFPHSALSSQSCCNGFCAKFCVVSLSLLSTFCVAFVCVFRS